MALFFWIWFLSFSILYTIQLFQINLRDDLREENGTSDKEIVIPVPSIRYFVFAPYTLIIFIYFYFFRGRDVVIK